MTGERRLLAGAFALALVVSAATVGVVATGVDGSTVAAADESAGAVEVSDLTLVIPESQRTYVQPPETGVVVRNETATVEATVTNTGNATATRTVELGVDLDRDGTPTPVGVNESVTLDSGESRTLTLDYSTEGVRGDTFVYGVFSGDDSATGHLSVGVPTDAESASVTFDDQTVPADSPAPVVRSATFAEGGFVWVWSAPSAGDTPAYATAWVPDNTTVRNLTTTRVPENRAGIQPLSGEYEAITAKRFVSPPGDVLYDPYRNESGGEISDTATVTVGESPTVTPRENVTVDSDSAFPVRLFSDVSDSDLRVEWEQVSGPSVQFDGPRDGYFIEFETPAVPSTTTFTFRLTTTDANGNTASALANATVRADESADPDASFAVVDLSAPGVVDQGANANVSATVSNVGDTTATQSVSYGIDLDGDGELEPLGTDRSVTLAPAENRTVEFDAPVTVDSAGTYTHGVVTAGVAQTDNVSVRESGTYFQVDFVAGQPMELSADRLYADQNRLIRWAHGVTRDDVSLGERGRAWANASVRECVDPSRIESDGATAEVSFSVAEGCDSLTLSLVTYTKPGADFSRETAGQQELFDATTRTFGPGDHTLTVTLPANGTATDDGTASVRAAAP